MEKTKEEQHEWLVVRSLRAAGWLRKPIRLFKLQLGDTPNDRVSCISWPRLLSREFHSGPVSGLTRWFFSFFPHGGSPDCWQRDEIIGGIQAE